MVVMDDGKNYLDMGDGVWVQDDALRVAQAVHDYDENLIVICLDPTHPDVKITDAPFVVMQRMPNGSYQKVLEAWELDNRVLERIWLSDQHRNNQLQTLEQMEKSIREGQEKRYRETLDEAKELALDVIVSKASSYSFKNKRDDIVKIHEDDPNATLNNAKKSFS